MAQNNTSDTVEYIDLTPTWAGLLPAFLAVVANAETVEGRKAAEGELLNMARLADRLGQLVKMGKANPNMTLHAALYELNLVPSIVPAEENT